MQKEIDQHIQDMFQRTVTQHDQYIQFSDYYG